MVAMACLFLCCSCPRCVSVAQCDCFACCCCAVIASDKSGAFSISSMKADYEAMMKAAATGSPFKSRVRRTAAEMGHVPTHVAIEELRKPMGGAY